MFTERLEWTWKTPSARPEVPLSTDNPANPGLGGYFVAARMLGDGTALLGNSGPRIVYAPLFGTSWIGFGMYSDAGVFTNYVFGSYSNYTATAPQYKPARFLVETYGTVGVPPPACPADIDGDGTVSASDLSALLGSWGPCGAKCPADIDGDGTVSASDLSTLLGAWGPCS
ncbi:MAG: dockerin type I repeat-containing protein [bacterium]